MRKLYKASCLKDTKDAAYELAPMLKGVTVFLNGPLGAGKTAFVSFAAKALGATDEAASPTFSIANRYETNSIPVIHIDLYRLETEEELEMTGFWEIINESATIFIEWAGKFPLKEYIKKYAEIDIAAGPGETREIEARLPNGR